MPRRVHVGVFYVTPTLALQDVGVDSNVYNQVTTDDPVSDFTFTVVPTFVATAGRRRASLGIRSSTGLVYFAHQQSERSVNEDLGVNTRVRLRRLTLLAEAGYLNTRERPNQEIDARSRRVHAFGDGGVAVSLWPKLSAQVNARYSRTIFDADAIFDDTFLAEELNRTTISTRAAVSYLATPLTTFVLSGDVESARFLDAPLRDSRSQRIAGGVELRPRALLAGSVSVGVQRFRPLSAVLPEFDGLVWSAGVKYRLRGATTLGLIAERNITYSYLELQPYYLRQGYGVSLRRQIVSRWDAEVSGGQFSHRYQQFRTASAVELIPDETFIDAALIVSYQARPGTRISGGLTYHGRRSEFLYRSYDSLRVGTSITYGF